MDPKMAAMSRAMKAAMAELVSQTGHAADHAGKAKAILDKMTGSSGNEPKSGMKD